MGIDIRLEVNGPFFDGHFQAYVRAYRDHLMRTLGDKGVAWIRAYLPTQYMYLGNNGGNPKDNPVPGNAGYYQSVIHTLDTGNAVLIHDTPCVYGPWLEGVGSRNPIVWPGRIRRGLSPRFEGYHTFRIIAQELNARAEEIGYAELPPYVAEMN